MEANELVDKIHQFLFELCEGELREQVRLGRDYLPIDFQKIVIHDTDLADILLDEPETFLKCAELAAKSFNFSRVPEHFNLRIFNLPKSSCISIREIRKQHQGKLITVEGAVRQKSDVKPKTKASRFKCHSCGGIVPILQIDQKYTEPSFCTVCGKRTKFHLESEDLEDVQWMMVEESMDSSSGDRTKKLKIFLEADLTSPLSEKKTMPGNKVKVTGILKKVAIELKTGAKSTQSDLLLEANHIEPVEEFFEELNITPEDEAKIKCMSKRNPFSYMVDALLPDVYGYGLIKRSLVLQCFGGVRKPREEGFDLRGDIHILLCGDPGVAKSGILKTMCNVWPKSRFIVAASMTGVGLTGAVVKDEFLRGYTLEAGALSLANKGMCAIDELDKTSDEDRNKLHEAMEQQHITISKANIQERLPSETTILAAANPKMGRFDPMETELSQVDLPPPLKNRFDLIFILKDVPNEEDDRKKADFILKKHVEAIKGKVKGENPFNDVEFFQKYIAYARTHCKPMLSEEAQDTIREYFVGMRRSAGSNEQLKSVSITARQLDAIVRLSEACAKVRLSDIVTKDDAEYATSILEECLKTVALDTSTGKLDVDIISTGTSSSKRNKINMVRSEFKRLMDDKKQVRWEALINSLKESGLDSFEAEEIINKLKQSGDFFEPVNGTLQMME